MKTKVLLVEDDKTFFDCIRLMLSDKNVDVIWAETGAQGIQLYKQDPHSYSVVIIDYLLPDFKGTEVCQHLRKINTEQEFLFASGHFELEYLTDQLETGASGFLKKGTAINEMKDKILSSSSRYQNRNRLLSSKDYEPTKSELELKKSGFVGRAEVPSTP